MEFRISPTKLNTFVHCPAMYYYQHCMNLPAVESIHLLKGSIVHSVLEQLATVEWFEVQDHIHDEDALRQQMGKKVARVLSKELLEYEAQEFCARNDEDYNTLVMDASWILDGWVLWYVRNVYAHIRAGKDPYDAWSYVAPRNRYGDKAVELEIVLNTDMWVERYTNEVFPNGKPHNITTPESFQGNKVLVPVKLKGIVDLVREMDNDTKAIRYDNTGLTDYKTSKVFKLPISDDYTFQMLFYAYLWGVKYGKLPSVVMVHYLRTMDLPMMIPPENTADLVLEKIKFLLHAVQNSMYPANPSYQFCNFNDGQIRCDYWDICHEEGRYDGSVVQGEHDPDFGTGNQVDVDQAEDEWF